MNWSKPRASLALLIATGSVATMLATGSAQAAGSPTWLVGYAANVQNTGWQPEVYDNHVAGTTGESLRMEALKIQLNSAALPPGASVCYTAYVQNTGSQPQVCNGAIAGTVGQGLRMEALQIQLVNAPGWGVCYSAHVQNIGWQPYVCDGALAGTVGQGLRMEAIQIGLVHTFTNVSTGLALDSNASGNVYALPPNGGNYQRWIAAPARYGTETLTDVATGRCLDSNLAGSVYTLPCNGGAYQQWTDEPPGPFLPGPGDHLQDFATNRDLFNPGGMTVQTTLLGDGSKDDQWFPVAGTAG